MMQISIACRSMAFNFYKHVKLYVHEVGLKYTIESIYKYHSSTAYFGLSTVFGVKQPMGIEV